jgi:hypothetical protein
MRGDFRSRDQDNAFGRASQTAPSTTAAYNGSPSTPRLRLQFSVRGLMFMAATFAVGCALLVHTPSVYGKIAASSIFAFWTGYGCILAGDELFVRGGMRHALLSRVLLSIGAPTLLIAVLSGTTSTLMALANQFIARPHSSWSLTPAQPDRDEHQRRKREAPVNPPLERRRPGPSEHSRPAELASRCSVAGHGVT